MWLMILKLWERLGGYLVIAAAILAGLFVARQSGKSAARNEAAAKVNEQAAQARKEQRDVENEIASLDDDDVDRRLNDWVRRK